MAMVSPTITMKKRTVTAAYASAAAWFPSPSELSDSKDVYIKKADAATTPTPTQAAAAAAAPDGLDLLFAASQAEAETKLKCKESDANSAGAGDGAKGNEPVVGDDESRDNDNEPENLATAALKNQKRAFHNSSTRSLSFRSVSPSFTGFPMASRSSLQTRNDSLVRFFPNTSVGPY
eukprot:scaffold5490_cov148-Skeletonema_marinoi.AAC.7